MASKILPAEIKLINEAKDLDSSWWPDDLEYTKLVKDDTQDNTGIPDTVWCLRADDVMFIDDGEYEGDEWKYGQITEIGESVPLDDRLADVSCPLTDGQAARIIRDALHARILELGAVVHGSGDCHYTIRKNNLIAVAAPTMIIAMCQYIIRAAENRLGAL